jgi:hypothetical protein
VKEVVKPQWAIFKLLRIVEYYFISHKMIELKRKDHLRISQRHWLYLKMKKNLWKIYSRTVSLSKPRRPSKSIILKLNSVLKLTFLNRKRNAKSKKKMRWAYRKIGNHFLGCWIRKLWLWLLSEVLYRPQLKLLSARTGLDRRGLWANRSSQSMPRTLFFWMVLGLKWLMLTRKGWRCWRS